MMQFNYDPSEMNVIDTREPRNYIHESTPDELGRYDVVLYNNSTIESNCQYTDTSMHVTVDRLNRLRRTIILHGDGSELSDFKMFGSFIMAKLKPSPRLLETLLERGGNLKFKLNVVKCPWIDPIMGNRCELLDISGIKYEIV